MWLAAEQFSGDAHPAYKTYCPTFCGNCCLHLKLSAPMRSTRETLLMRRILAAKRVDGVGAGNCAGGSTEEGLGIGL